MSLGVNSAEMVSNFGLLANMLVAVSIFFGILLFVHSLSKFKKLGEGRSMMSGQESLGEPLFIMVAAVLLLTLPMMIPMFSDMIFGTTEIIAYNGSWSAANFDSMDAVVIFVRVIGIGSMINGFIKLSRVGGHQGQAGMAGKAAMFIVGGIMCVNCVATFDLLQNLFGL